MKVLFRSVTILASLACVPTTAIAQLPHGSVVISTDPVAYSWCNLGDVTEGVTDLYIFYGQAAQAMGVRFKLESSAGMTMTYLSEEHYFPVSDGDTQSGITFCFGNCVEPLPIVLAKVTYMRHGTSAECSTIEVVPHPDSNAIETLQCNGDPSYANGGHLFLNNSTGCGEHCSDTIYYGPSGKPYDFCEPVSTEFTTWGAIKSLYR